MGFALPLIFIAIILLTAGLRYPADCLGFASPVVMPATLWLPMAAAIAIAGALLAASGLRQGGDGRAAFMQLLVVLGGFFAFEWGMLPAYRWRAVDWAIMAMLILLVAAFLWRDRADAGKWGLTGDRFSSAWRLLAAPTAIMVLCPVAAALISGWSVRPGRLILDILGYPLYALVQLTVFQVFVTSRLRKFCGVCETITVAAAIFALAHWPNGLVMAVTGLCAVVWTAVYIKRPNIYALALSMGLAAAVFVNLVPANLTHNMRTGPIYVQRMLDKRCHIGTSWCGEAASRPVATLGRLGLR